MMCHAHAFVKILPVNYILKGNSSKFSSANNLHYTVYGILNDFKQPMHARFKISLLSIANNCYLVIL